MALLKELGMDYLKLRRNILVPTMAMTYMYVNV